MQQNQNNVLFWTEDMHAGTSLRKKNVWVRYSPYPVFQLIALDLHDTLKDFGPFPQNLLGFPLLGGYVILSILIADSVLMSIQFNTNYLSGTLVKYPIHQSKTLWTVTNN